MRKVGSALAIQLVGLALILGGCGTYVPEIQEFPGNSVDGQRLVRAIVASIHCELRNAITYTIDQDKRVAQLNTPPIRSAAWFDDWGVQVGLTLTIEEKTTLNPTTVWMPPSPPKALFTLAGGATLSTDATRTDKLNYYYTVKELYSVGACPPNADPTQPLGSLLIQSDLKLREWLLSQVLAVGTGEIRVPTNISTPLKQNALSHEVKFEVLSSGNITPAWKLVRVTVDQSGSLYAASRDRIHDLLVTFGPIDPSTRGLVGAAAAAYYASQIGLAVNSNLRGPLP